MPIGFGSAFDDTLTDHIKDRFGDDPALAEKTYQAYLDLLDEAYLFVQRGEPPESACSMVLAEKWWNMIMDFTGGDLTLLPKLESFNDDKTGWDKRTGAETAGNRRLYEQNAGLLFQKTGNGYPRNGSGIMSDAIRVENLRKSYGSKEVLKGISFDVSRGEIFALLGINGAGKTTTLECMEGLKKYDSGSIAVNDRCGVRCNRPLCQAT